MSADSEDVERLRQVAFGPNASAHERADAERALQAIEQAAALAVEPHQSAEASGAEHESTEHPFNEDELAPDAAPSMWQRRIRLGWLIPVAVGALLLGVVGALVYTGEIVLSAGQPKTIDVTLPQVDATGPGDLEAANSWFDKPSEPEGAFPDSKILKSLGINQADVKSATSNDVPPGALWIARHGTTGFCMIAFTYLKDPATVTNCVSAEDFRTVGLSIVTPFYAAHWDGVLILVNR